MHIVQASTHLNFYYQETKQVLAATIVKLNEIRCDPEAFQKACIVIRSIVQGIHFYYPSHSASQFVKALNITESFDVYGFCRLPRYFFYRYIPDRLDEYVILNQLEVILCHNWSKGALDRQGVRRDVTVYRFAEKQLTVFLNQMVEEGQEHHSEQELRKFLSQSLVQELEAHPVAGFDPHKINLKDLSIPFKTMTWLDLLIDTVFVSIDIACLPAFLHEWSLLDLTYYANQIGKYPFLSWVPDHSLDRWIWGMMATGFLLQFLQGCYRLFEEGLTLEERRDAKWQIAASLAEYVYCLSILQSKALHFIVLLAFLAKSLGLYRFIVAPKPSFFTIDPFKMRSA